MVETREFILTGKARESFDFWNFENCRNAFEYMNWHLLSERTLHDTIVDWFDSVGLHLNVNYNMGLFSYNVLGIDPYYDTDLFDSRQESTEKGIIKMNEMYNKL